MNLRSVLLALLLSCAAVPALAAGPGDPPRSGEPAASADAAEAPESPAHSGPDPSVADASASGWTGTGELGFALSRGNARSESLNTRLAFAREDARKAAVRVSKDPFDLVICDPPKLAGTRANKEVALKAYRTLAASACGLAMRMNRSK